MRYFYNTYAMKTGEMNRKKGYKQYGSRFIGDLAEFQKIDRAQYEFYLEQEHRKEANNK